MLTVHNVSEKLNTGAALYQAGLIAGVEFCACDCLHGNAECLSNFLQCKGSIELRTPHFPNTQEGGGGGQRLSKFLCQNHPTKSDVTSG